MCRLISSFPSHLPLCVDLDGTLIQTDLLIETTIQLLRKDFTTIFFLGPWLWKGKAFLKDQIARRIEFDPGTLPYNPDVLRCLQEAHARGQTVILATASDLRLANSIAKHLGIFSEVFASDAKKNLSGRLKREALTQRFGEKGYFYLGNAPVDTDVLAHAASGLIIRSNVSRGRAILKAMRVQHWIKNLLVFAPAVLAHETSNPRILGLSLLAFVSFCFSASGVYVMNDFFDLTTDRGHPQKRLRPLASGTLPPALGLAWMCGLWLAALLIASGIGMTFFAAISFYLLFNLLYSVRLKRIAFLDVFFLASLYALRLAAGSAATGVPISFWLLAFSIFFFLSLAMAKRYAELLCLGTQERREGTPNNRNYYQTDAVLLLALGAPAGQISALVLALYINSEKVRQLYSRPEDLWIVCLILMLWISRVWILAHRRELDEDPITFAVGDRFTYVLGALSLLVIFYAH
jgi:4-hydroxybenzoate polyprenyltransferase